MTEQKIDENLRIPKTKGRIMIAIAIFFDLLPIIALGIALYASYQAFGDNWATRDYFYHSSKASEWCIYAEAHPYNIFAKERCFHHKIRARNSVYYAAGIFTAFGAVGAILIGPLIYETVSFISTILAYFLFTLWFLFNRVNIWSFSKPKKVFLNLTTMIIEEIPLLDLLPGTTFMVWRHVKMSQMEDKIKNQEKAKNTKNKLLKNKNMAYAR